MTSFQLSITPRRRAAARFVAKVRQAIQKAYADSPEIRQTDIANKLEVHRSVINRQLNGRKDMSVARVAEIAWALGYEPVFELEKPRQPDGCNTPIWTRSLASTQGSVSKMSSKVDNAAGQFVVLERTGA